MIGNESERAVLHEMQKALKTVEQLINTMDTKTQIALSEVRMAVEQLRRDTKVLLDIVRDGNGKKAIIERMREVERDVESIIGRIDSAGILKSETTKQKWTVVGLAVAALITAIGSVIVAWLKH